jgi:hypothetical protein
VVLQLSDHWWTDVLDIRMLAQIAPQLKKLCLSRLSINNPSECPNFPNLSKLELYRVYLATEVRSPFVTRKKKKKKKKNIAKQFLIPRVKNTKAFSKVTKSDHVGAKCVMRACLGRPEQGTAH